MNRRSLLGFLFAAPLAAKAAVKIAIGDGAPLTTLVNLTGPPLAPPPGSMFLTTPKHAGALWPGIREWHARQYAEGRIDELLTGIDKTNTTERV